MLGQWCGWSLPTTVSCTAVVTGLALHSHVIIILSPLKTLQSFLDSLRMRVSSTSSALSVILVLCCLNTAQAQFGGFDIFRPLQNLFQPVMRFFGGPRFRDDGTKAPQATGIDKLFPDDCGRDEDKGTGKLCFPDGKLCENRKFRCFFRFKLIHQIK